MPLARSVAATGAASTASSKSIVPTTSERFAGSATNGVANAARLGPAVEVARRLASCAARTSPGRRCSSIHSIWSASRSSVRDRRRVVGLVLARVVERGRERQELGDPARRVASISRDALAARRGSAARATGRRRRRSTSAARSSRRRPARRRPAGRRRPRSRRSATSASSPPAGADRDHHAGRGLVVRPGDDVARSGRDERQRARRRASAVDDDRVLRGTARRA